MTFGLFERSRTRGVPVDLFLFQVSGQRYAYTDADDAITRNEVIGGETVSVTYAPVPVSRSTITSSGGLDRSTVTITLADNVALCALLRDYPQSNVITVTIRQGHLTDPDAQFLVAWAGRVLSSRGALSKREITCQPISTALRRVGLRRNWQYGCPHVLYGDRCRASRPAATVAVTSTSGVKNAVTLPSGWNAQPVEKYQGGLLAWTDNIRTIIRVVGNTLYLGGPAPTAPVAVMVSLGCDHTPTDCQMLHVPVDETPYGGGNIHNYGGQPFIPTKSPIGYVSNFG